MSPHLTGSARVFASWVGLYLLTLCSGGSSVWKPISPHSGVALASIFHALPVQEVFFDFQLVDQAVAAALSLFPGCSQEGLKLRPGLFLWVPCSSGGWAVPGSSLDSESRQQI